MKTPTSDNFFHRASAVCLVGLFLCVLLPQSRAAEPYKATNGEFSVVGDAVVELLQSHDTARFAKELAPTIEDFRAILSTNTVVKDADPLKGFQGTVEDDRRRVESSAKALLAKAETLHLDFSKGKIQMHINTPKYLGTTRWSSLQAENESVPYAEEVEIEFNLDSDATSSTNGNFKIAVRGLNKFPGGWRTYQGVQWLAFPTNIADEKTQREISIMSLAMAYKGFDSQLDPSLTKLGETLVRFLRERDMRLYQQEALVTADMTWAQLQKSAGGKGPSRQEFDKMWNEHQSDLIDAARSTLKQMDDAGIDLKDAKIQIQEAAVEQSDLRSGPGSLDGLEGNQFQVKLSVKSERKAKIGKSLSGDYVLAVNEITRFGDDWRITDKVRWDKFPAGVVDEKTEATLEFENHVAKYRSLPPGMAAPEIEFIRFDNEQKMKLSDLRGKVVVLDFWATWCGPCQEPMAKLQTIRQAHPDWKDSVTIVPLSIDDTLKQVRDHVDKRGWTNTFNVWAGPGGWISTPAKTFRVTGVPTTYIIDTKGKIVNAGYPLEDWIVQIVNGLLKAQKP
ncbi:MAG: TlpA disulfide reductase family protein [Verrucomicrobiota bacterium]|jgi:thiol-disulfide isomerase/thioredoxin